MDLYNSISKTWVVASAEGLESSRGGGDATKLRGWWRFDVKCQGGVNITMTDNRIVGTFHSTFCTGSWTGERRQ
jgi:hypothetical protein